MMEKSFQKVIHIKTYKQSFIISQMLKASTLSSLWDFYITQFYDPLELVKMRPLRRCSLLYLLKKYLNYYCHSHSYSHFSFLIIIIIIIIILIIAINTSCLINQIKLFY